MAAAQNDPKKMIKIGIVIALLVAAGIVIAYNQGVFAPPPQGVPTSPEIEKALQQQREEAQKAGLQPAGGGN